MYNAAPIRAPGKKCFEEKRQSPPRCWPIARKQTVHPPGPSSVGSLVLKLNCLVVCFRVAVGGPVGSVAVIIVVALIGQIGQTEFGTSLLIVGPHQPCCIAVTAANAHPVGVSTPACLHTQTSLNCRDHVRAGGIVAAAACNILVTVRVRSRQVQQVDAGESDQETAEKRYRVDRVGCIETAEKDEGGA